MYHSLHITLQPGLFLCITHSVIFHVTTHTCCITSPSLITCTISPLITNTLPHSPLPATLSSLDDILTLTEPTSPSHPTSCILQCRPLTIQLFDSPAKQQTCKLHLPLHFLLLHNHRISTSRSPLQINCTYDSDLTLAQNPSHTPPNLPIHTTPITTPTLPTTPFPLPSRQT